MKTWWVASSQRRPRRGVGVRRRGVGADRRVRDRAEDRDPDRAAGRAAEQVGAGDDAALTPADARLRRDQRRHGDQTHAEPDDETGRRRPARPIDDAFERVSNSAADHGDRRRRSAHSCGTRSGCRAGRPARPTSASPGSARRRRDRPPAARCRARPGRRSARRTSGRAATAPTQTEARLVVSSSRRPNTHSGSTGSARPPLDQDERDQQTDAGDRDHDARRRRPGPGLAALEHGQDDQRAADGEQAGAERSRCAAGAARPSRGSCA